MIVWLVWAIIPLVVLSIVGIQESFEASIGSPNFQLESGVAPDDITCRDNLVLVLRTNGNPACVTETSAEKLGWQIINKTNGATSQASYYYSNLTIDHPPKLGDTAVLTLEVLAVGGNTDDFPDYRTTIRLPEGFELVSGNLVQTNLWKAGESLTVQATIKSVQTGNWTIDGTGIWGTGDVLYITVSEDDAYLNEYPFLTTPQLNQHSVPCIGISEHTNENETLRKILESSPNSTNADTLWTGVLTMSSTSLQVGETTDFILTVNASSWPPNPPIQSLWSQICFIGDGHSLNFVSGEPLLELNFDHLEDEHYYTVTGQSIGKKIGTWEFTAEIQYITNYVVEPVFVTVTEDP